LFSQNTEIILSKLIAHDKDLEKENLAMLDTDYGENERNGENDENI
jgi:hypothetical protein